METNENKPPKRDSLTLSLSQKKQTWKKSCVYSWSRHRLASLRSLEAMWFYLPLQERPSWSPDPMLSFSFSETEAQRNEVIPWAEKQQTVEGDLRTASKCKDHTGLYTICWLHVNDPNICGLCSGLTLLCKGNVLSYWWGFFGVVVGFVGSGADSQERITEEIFGAKR